MNQVVQLQGIPERIGLKRGQNVVLSADVTRLAWMHRRSGTQRVPGLLLEAFLEHLGPDGTLVVPTFNHDLQDGGSFDRQRTPPITGVLPTIALAHPAFLRTRHPLHSFAVAGAAQARFLALDDASSFSDASPFALFRTQGFVVVGVDMALDHAFSYFHHVEERERVPYRRWRDLRIHYTDEGRGATRRYRFYAKRWGYANRLRDLHPLLEQAGAMRSYAFEGIRALTVDVSLAHPVIERDIRTNRARSIVHFTARNWVRDLVRTVCPRSSSPDHPSPSDARSH